MRILMLNYEFPPIGGGGATSTFSLARSLAELGHRVDVVTMGFDRLPRFEVVDGVRVHRVPSFRRRREVCDTREMITFVASGLVAATRLARSESFDVNNTHFVFPTGPIAYGLRRLTGLPYVLTARGSDVPGHNPNRFRLDHRLLFPFWRRLVQDADAVTAVSKDLKTQIQRLAPRVPVTVIPNGVSRIGESAGPAGRPVPIEERARRVLVVSRLHEFKGVQYLLRAVTDYGLDYEVHIVGDGPYRSALEGQASALGERVHFWGWLERSGAGLRDLYQRCGIFVFPSEREGAPAALMEAMSEGLAVIAADSAGTPEVVGDAGLLVAPRSAADIAAALDELSSNPERIEELGRLARARVVEHFDWLKLAQQYADLYERIASRGGAQILGERAECS